MTDSITTAKDCIIAAARDVILQAGQSRHHLDSALIPDEEFMLLSEAINDLDELEELEERAQERQDLIDQEETIRSFQGDQERAIMKGVRR